MPSDRLALSPTDARDPQSRIAARLADLERQVEELRSGSRIQRGVYSAGATPTTVLADGFSTSIPLLTTMTFQAPGDDTPVFIWASSKVTMPNTAVRTGVDNPLNAYLAFRQEEVTPLNSYNLFAGYVESASGWTGTKRIAPPVLGANAWIDRPDTITFDPVSVDRTFTFGGGGEFGSLGVPIMYLAPAGPVTLKFYAYTGDLAAAAVTHNYQFWNTTIYASLGGL